jgi:hypothetical protein
LLRVIKGEKRINNIYYDAYNLLGMTYCEQGEFENGIIYHNKALAVIDNIIPRNIKLELLHNNMGFLFKC